MLKLAPGFRLEIERHCVQQIAPASQSHRFEGIDFSRSGEVMAIATSETNNVLLFRRKPDGRFEDEPFRTIHELDYPHDVAFSKSADRADVLAVAQRGGAIAIYEKNETDGSYGPEPVFGISGARAKLAGSDGVTFVPPHEDYLAACNLHLGTIVFFRRRPGSSVAFEETPEFELTHESVFEPDGLAFSGCGKWLATANHGKQSVSIFQRGGSGRRDEKLSYGPEPVTVIRDPQFRFPHSVAFTPRTSHLIVTNAGANCFTVYAPRRHYAGVRWSQAPVERIIANDDGSFREANIANKLEGGPKGIAIHQGHVAVCSPQIGVKFYSFRERNWLSRRNKLLPRYDRADLQSIDTRVRFDMADQNAPLEWHDLETGPQGSFRWTGPEPRASIRLPVKFDRDLIARIHVLLAIKPDVIKALKLSFQGRKIRYRREAAPDGTVVIVARLKHSFARRDRDFELTLDVAETLRPCDHLDGHDDARALGLAVGWIELEAA